jgi:hypothetical protein
MRYQGEVEGAASVLENLRIEGRTIGDYKAGEMP